MAATLNFDLNRYLERIGYRGDRSPTQEVLDALVAHHARAIPFENLDPFLGAPNRLDLASLQTKMVEVGRGGYCFEQNLLLRAGLITLGFEVQALAARVVWGMDPETITPRSHMLLTVGIDGQDRVVDVGFGGMVLTRSLALQTGSVQATPLEPFRFVEHRSDYRLEVEINNRWSALYRFDLQPQEPVDFEASNWYLSTWPESRFVTSLSVARATPDRRYTLRNRELAIHRPGYPTERRVLDSSDDLRETLDRDFKLNTEGLDLERAYELVVSS